MVVWGSRASRSPDYSTSTAFAPRAGASSAPAAGLIDSARGESYTSRMVEYAMLLAGNAVHSLALRASNVANSINWTYVGYAAGGLVALKIVSFMFRRSH